jgi:hypothetical protein
MRRMIPKAILFLTATPLVSAAATPIEPDVSTGSVCLAPVSNPAPGDPFGKTGGGREFNYSVQIDKGAIVPLSIEKPIQIAGLVPKQKHLIKIRTGKSLAQSFFFTFESLGSGRLCLWYRSFYRDWHLWPARDGGKKCQCE